MPIDLQTSIRYLKGVGERRAALYGKLGIETMEDLLYHIPRDYIDLSHPLPLAEAQTGQKCAVRALLATKGGEQRIRRGLSLFRLTAVDGPVTLQITFFNAGYTVGALREGEEYIFYGRLEGGFYRKTMDSPQVFPAAESGSLLPVYSLTEGLSNKVVSTHVREALARVEELPDPLGTELPRCWALLPYEQALRSVHFPTDWAQVQAGRSRMVFDEFLTISLCFAKMRQGRLEQHVTPMRMQPLTAYYNALSYRLTGAQQRAIEEALGDMCSGAPMNRLVQGDVGSGKTAVAAACCYFAYLNGCQSALMAPTEILAQQHYLNLAPLLEGLGMRTALLTGSLSPKKKETLKATLAAGEIDLCIGTHALLTADTAFAHLGLVVTDEQHRFGVNQRAALGAKGENPHLLVMSATPIPRTLALMIYGDLDVSVIDELPPGRRSIETYAVPSSYHERIYAFLEKQLAEGRQAYIVCPMVEENGELPDERKAVTAYAEKLQKEVLPNRTVRFLHGKMKAKEKETVMRAFAAGEIDVLVSTTVVEVGVDVPNASVMLIENAECFGLSQLHQLRGRVGRGPWQSYCILVSDNRGEDNKTRLDAMRRTQSGFALAEEDLKLRGPGDFFGARQHGLPTLRVADFTCDMELLYEAQGAAEALLALDPRLEGHPALHARVRELFDLNAEALN